ncbi:MAG: hypothetical protein H0U21_15135, partial [Acidimicrobiia bacterium]|nr:hypothetical protein [Acidimicrobiia bacterium]
MTTPQLLERVDMVDVPHPQPVSRPRAAVAGAIAAGVALGVGELGTALLDSGPSLVTAVGSEFVDRFAASLKTLAVSLFGTNDKVALVTGIVITSVLFGAVIGLASRRRWLVAPVGFAMFGLVGAWALASDPQGSTSRAILAAAVSVAAGIGAFTLLARPVRPAGPAAAD